MDSSQPKRLRTPSPPAISGHAASRAATAVMTDSAAKKQQQQQQQQFALSSSQPSSATQSAHPTPHIRSKEEREAAAAAGHARWLALSPAQRCFSDGLGVAFSHLTLAELVTAARSCKSWYEGAKRVKKLGDVSPQLVDASRRRFRERLNPDSLGARLLTFSTSPFRHLVRKLQGSFESEDMDEARTSDNSEYLAEQYEKHPSAWRLADLRQLERLPHITRINSTLLHMANLAPRMTSDAGNIRFPRRLQAIDLHFSPYKLEGKDDSFDGYDRAVRAVLDGLSACTSLAEVKLTALEVREWDLTPLLQIKRLRRLTIQGWPDKHYGDKQIAVIKQIATLRSLKLLRSEDCVEDMDDPFDPSSWLAELCRPPHQLQRLEELDLSHVSLSLTEMLQLQQLPGLTALEPESFSLDALPGLAPFTHLRRLSLEEDPDELPDGMFDDHGYARASNFLPHLRCTGLQKLALKGVVFSDEEAETLCQLLPQLTDLSLGRVGWPSLEPLRHLAKLAKLALTPLFYPPLDFALAHLQALKSLQKLRLERIHPPLDAATVAALQPPSALMPTLQSFDYTPRSK